MRVLVAPDKFKGTLTAAEVAGHLVAGLRDAGHGAVELPVADGGEGTLEAALAAGFRRIPVTASGPTGKPVDTAFGLRGGTAVVELAAASGLALADPDPLRAGSRGTGELLAAALDAGARRIILGLGGSACTDGGAGLLAALGARIVDADGEDLPDGGGALRDAADVDLRGLDPRLAEVEIVLACDVDNPLLGPHGAAAVYGPQKGAGPREVALLDAGLTRFASLVARAPGLSQAEVPVTRASVGARSAAVPGAGAAGGVGFAALTVLGARRRPGIEVVLDLVGFAEHLRGASLVVTGEGALDAQTLHGKAPAGVAAAARAARVPAIAVCGRCDLDPDVLAHAGLTGAIALADLDPERCLSAPGPLLRRIGRGLGTDLEGCFIDL
ncbi:glycerate kinase [Pseudonocardia xishanensis]|uniref:Glycerate kinase n=1 Tax=Pseudonocardia xishanensis TaxID=630995 RepID=A0ABP8RUL5_9PSEU